LDVVNVFETCFGGEGLVGYRRQDLRFI